MTIRSVSSQAEARVPIISRLTRAESAGYRNDVVEKATACVREADRSRTLRYAIARTKERDERQVRVPLRGCLPTEAIPYRQR